MWDRVIYAFWANHIFWPVGTRWDRWIMEPKGRDSRKQIVIFKQVTTFFDFEDMFRCYKHHRQLQNI